MIAWASVTQQICAISLCVRAAAGCRLHGRLEVHSSWAKSRQRGRLSMVPTLSLALAGSLRGVMGQRLALLEGASRCCILCAAGGGCAAAGCRKGAGLGVLQGLDPLLVRCCRRTSTALVSCEGG